MIALVVILATIFIITLTLLYTRWMNSKSDTILREWADEEGYTIISSEYRWARRGPFALRTAEDQVVFYVEVITAEGGTKKGWVRCGSMWRGLIDHKAEVRWDEQEGENNVGVSSS